MKRLNECFETNPRERRNLEYERGGDWKSPKHNIAKAALVMANLRDGGHIVIGAREDSDGHDFAGMGPDEAGTYKDDIGDFVKYAYPPIEIDVGVFDGRFAVVEVSGFQDMPAIRKKDSGELRRGRPYARSRHKNESASQLAVYEMREIVENAAGKEIRKQRKRMESLMPRNGADPFGGERREV